MARRGVETMTPETEHMAGQCRSGAHDQRDRAHEQDTVEAVVSERWKWQRAYVSRLRWTDAVVVVLAGDAGRVPHPIDACHR